VTESVPARQSTKLKDGIVAFIHGNLPGAQKLLAIDVRDAFPMISFGEVVGVILLHSDGSQEAIEADHLSVPPNLRLHITIRNPRIEFDQIMFDVSPLMEALNNPSIPVTHFFTFIGVPYLHTEPLVKPGKKKVWYRGALITPLKDNGFTNDTRMSIEFYLHTGDFNEKDIEGLPFTIPHMNMRLAPDRGGAVFGPFSFGGIQRRDLPSRQDIKFSIRMCYAEPADARPVVFIYTPLAQYYRRPRKKSA
jgi:hypothetical protein